MTRRQIIEQIQAKKSFLCIGLDTDVNQIPRHLQNHPDAVFEFNKAIIDATKDLCVSYKINTAFYEAMGVSGWAAMEKTIQYIPAEHFVIADAKRGDIGNTSAQYARAFFETLNFDALTVAPYMGEDSIKPFWSYENKWVIALALTSNKGAADFEMLKAYHHAGGSNEDTDDYLFEKVIKTIVGWGTTDNLMFVTGATQIDALAGIRKIVPDHFLLVPGVGFQGGSLSDVCRHLLIKDVGLLVNVSRAIIYAGEKEDFAAEARAIAQQYQVEMATYLA